MGNLNPPQVPLHADQPNQQYEAQIKPPAPLSSHGHEHSAPRKVLGTRFSTGLSGRRQAAMEARAGRRRAGSAPAARAETRGGHPRALPRPAGTGGPAHLEEVILVHHAAVGQGPHQPPGQGGLAAVGDPAARARPSGSATWGRVHPPTPTAAPGGAGMRDPCPSRSPSRFPRRSRLSPADADDDVHGGSDGRPARLLLPVSEGRGRPGVSGTGRLRA